MFETRGRRIKEELLRRAASRVRPSDIAGLFARAEELTRRIEEEKLLERYVDEVKLTYQMLGDYWTGRYRQVPYWVIATVAVALLYLLSPVDLIPDFIPGLGVLDDIAVLGICLKLIAREVEEYRKWREWTDKA